MNKIFLSISVFFFLVGCQEEPDRVEEKKLENDLHVEENRQSHEEMTAEIQAEHDSSEVLKDVAAMLRNFPNEDLVMFYFKEGSEGFALVTDEKKGAFEFNQIGLFKANGEEILPIEFDRIHTPHKITYGTLEVRKSSKSGLYSLDGQELIPVDYDKIYPGFDDYLAVMVKGDEYSYLDLQNNVVPIKADDKNELVNLLYTNRVVKRWRFDISKEVVFHSVEVLSNEWDAPEGSGYFVPPSFLSDMGLIDEEITHAVGLKDQYFGEINTSISVDEVIETEDEGWIVMSDFFKEIPEARGYIERKKIVSAVSKEQEISSKEFIQEEDFNLCHTDFEFKRLGDTLMEFRKQDWGNNWFQALERYEYVALKEGKLIPYSSNRIFAFTEYVRIDESYFKGCWRKNIEDEEFDLLMYEHLTPEDLDVMRNEIFASYGYKFKTEKWASFFAKYKWYEGKYDNVDDMLSPIEKDNVKFILEYKSWLEENLDIVNEEKIDWSPAG